MKEIRGKKQFESITQGDTKSVVIISTPTCSLCRTVKNALSNCTGEFDVYSLDANDADNSFVVDELNVMSVPQVICCNNTTQKVLTSKEVRYVHNLHSVITKFFNKPVILEDTWYYETSGDLFDLYSVELYPDTSPKDYCLAHCISSDIGMFGGIARLFVDRMDMKSKIIKFLGDQQPPVKDKYGESPYINLVGKSILIDNVYNLITKPTVSSLPTMESLLHSLNHMKNSMLASNQKYLAIPKIGCGIDRLEWEEVSEMIRVVFAHTGIHIVVVTLDD